MHAYFAILVIHAPLGARFVAAHAARFLADAHVARLSLYALLACMAYASPCALEQRAFFLQSNASCLRKSCLNGFGTMHVLGERRGELHPCRRFVLVQGESSMPELPHITTGDRHRPRQTRGTDCWAGYLARAICISCLEIVAVYLPVPSTNQRCSAKVFSAPNYFFMAAVLT